MLGDICTRYRLKVNLRIFAIGRLLNKQLNTTVRNLRFSLVTSSYGVREEGKEMITPLCSLTENVRLIPVGSFLRMFALSL